MVLITDSVCLKVLSSESLIAGIGNEIRLYFIKNDQQTIENIFSHKLRDKIHEICIWKESVGKYLVIVYGGRELMILEVENNALFFILSTQINDWISTIHVCSSQELCLVTSHSVALRLIWSSHSKEIEINEKISCKDKSTLYTCRAIGDTWINTQIFGGTALGELIIWSVESNGDVLHRLSGHNGVIFSIDLNLPLNLLITTSDDRSIKIWHLNFGNGDNDKTLKKWQNVQIRSQKSMFGHTARVFCGKIFCDSDSKPFIVTIGEDSSVCLWTIDGNLLHRHTFLHRGTLWNCDYDAKTKTLFTCSSDGNIDQFSIEPFLNDTQPWLQPQKIQIPIVHDPEYIAKIKILNQKLICLSNENLLLVKSKSKQWISINIGYKSSLLECNDHIIATAGYKILSIFHLNDEMETLNVAFEETLMKSMIRSVKFLSKSELIICDDKGNCLLITGALKLVNQQFSWIAMDKMNFTIPSGKDNWITAALKIENNVFVSDRSGKLYRFYINNRMEIVLLDTLKHVHGYFGCTNLLKLNQHALISTGHDGLVKTIEWTKDRGSFRIRFNRKIAIQWIEKIFQFEDEQYFAGFNDNHFVICSRDKVIIEIECGGGHRFWDLSINGNRCEFYFIRNRNIYRIQFRLDRMKNQLKIPKNKWHTKSCNILRSIELDQDRRLIISGGDDNILKFHLLSHSNDCKPILKHIDDHESHISNVKTISVQKLDQNYFRIYSAGGRAQICVTEVQNDPNGQLTIKEYENFMLKSSDTDRCRQGKGNLIDFVPETRFMCSCQLGNSLYFGCSDGFIRHFIYNDGHTFQLKCAIFYGKCILNICLLDQRFLITMATDGLICFWKLEDSKETFYQIQHHESGINSFDLMFLDEWYYLATGGDDQSIVLSKFQVTFDLKIENIVTVNFNQLHTAQVTGLRFSKNHVSLYSTSVDQTIWKIDLKTNVAENICNICVADAKGLSDIFKIGQKENVFVYGCGLELVNINHR